MRALKTPAKVLALLAPLAAVLYLGHMELRVSGEFRILPAQNNDVRAEVEAIVEEIYVEEGTTVNKGDPIARLSDRDYRAELGKLRAEIDEKQANLRMLRAGPRTACVSRPARERTAPPVTGNSAG